MRKKGASVGINSRGTVWEIIRMGGSIREGKWGRFAAAIKSPRSGEKSREGRKRAGEGGVGGKCRRLQKNKGRKISRQRGEGSSPNGEKGEPLGFQKRKKTTSPRAEKKNNRGIASKTWKGF